MDSTPAFIPSTARADDSHSLVTSNPRPSLISARKVLTGMFLLGVWGAVAVTLATTRSAPTNKDNNSIVLSDDDAKAHLTAIMSQSHAAYAAKSTALIALDAASEDKQSVPSNTFRQCHQFSTCWECNNVGVVTGCKWADNACKSAPVDVFRSPTLDECSDVPATVREYLRQYMQCLFERSSCESSVCTLRIQTSPALAGQVCSANLIGEEPLLCNTAMVPGFREQCLRSCRNQARCHAFDATLCQDYPPAGAECSMESCSNAATIARCPRTCGVCNKQ